MPSLKRGSGAVIHDQALCSFRAPGAPFGQALREAIDRAERGLVDADLGGGVIKQRVAHSGEGRSGGYRTIIVYQKGERSVFVYGFAKSERDNIDEQELAAFRKAAAVMLAWDDQDIAALLAAGAWTEVE